MAIKYVYYIQQYIPIGVQWTVGVCCIVCFSVYMMVGLPACLLALSVMAHSSPLTCSPVYTAWFPTQSQCDCCCLPPNRVIRFCVVGLPTVLLCKSEMNAPNLFTYT